jgi:TRAP-type C4-dicarboxylate transport system permease small subunit
MWIVPLTMLTFMWVVVLTISIVFKKRGHIAITVVKDLLPDKLCLLNNIIVLSVSIFTLTLLLFSAIQVFPVHSRAEIIGLGISRVYYSSAILYLALSSLLTTFHFIFLDFKKLIGLITKQNSDSKKVCGGRKAKL